MEKYKISQVAKKFDISRTALIHYDKCGLLSPSYRGQNKYRLYTRDDLDKLELILALKESGLSLKEIQAYLSGDSHMSSIELLIHQKDEIDKKMATLEIQRQIIDKRINNLKKFNELSIYEGILIDTYPEPNFVREAIGYGPLMSYGSAVARLKKKLGNEGQMASKFGICFDISSEDKTGKYKMLFVFDYLSSQEDLKDKDHLKMAQYMRCIHKGKYTSAEKTIQKLKDYAKANNLQAGEKAYFVPLFDYWESMSEDFISEILIPLKNSPMH